MSLIGGGVGHMLALLSFRFGSGVLWRTVKSTVSRTGHPHLQTIIFIPQAGKYIRDNYAVEGEVCGGV
jgi:hypothetical protein